MYKMNNKEDYDKKNELSNNETINIRTQDIVNESYKIKDKNDINNDKILCISLVNKIK